jgi:hypothetical protein
MAKQVEPSANAARPSAASVRLDDMQQTEKANGNAPSAQQENFRVASARRSAYSVQKASSQLKTARQHVWNALAESLPTREDLQSAKTVNPVGLLLVALLTAQSVPQVG